jgi:hypothetical protein
MGSVIGDLRSLVPARPLTYEETLRVADRQAAHLLQLGGISQPPVPDALVAGLPRIQVDRLSNIPVSGSTHWTKGRWLIVLNGTERITRQRYSLMHEFKHVLDNPFVGFLYPPIPGLRSHERAELACDYFAACVLMPRKWVKRAWGNRIQDPSVLARRFRVSRTAMQVRLHQTGLMDPPPRCLGPDWPKATKRRSGTYYREGCLAA